MTEQNFIEWPTVWGGIECTINRVGNDYKDQLEYSGHYHREGDVEAIAALGIRTIRYPVLWERHCAKKNDKINWDWADRQLSTIRNSGMEPIVGLLHHGSGPVYTNLLDPEFPALLAGYAYEVASRFPWITNYTPVNEPLTTARFSGLYGLWYPHQKSEASFYRMLFNQLKGTVLAMEAIRSVNPAARLVQTEDLGKSYSTPLLAYQANFENDRRLLTFDILTGLLQPGHPQYDHMVNCGISASDLNFFQLHRVAPDIVGLNYYVTSERWLDESLEKFPPHTQGGNGKQRYADTELVRANRASRGGFKILAREIWERYKIPMAVTESHLHCTREEQLRWFKEIWDDSLALSAEGADIRGVTAWAMLGSFDWDTLLTKTGTQYESGVFDIQTFSGQLRPTALADLLKYLAGGKGRLHPVLEGRGWWRDKSIPFKKNRRPIVIKRDASIEENTAAQRELFFLFNDACRRRDIGVYSTKDIHHLDFEKLNPWAIVNIGGADRSLQAMAEQYCCQYVTLAREETGDAMLKIVVQRMPVTIHQIDKILDLIIDGVTGSWVFFSDKITCKTLEEKNQYSR